MNANPTGVELLELDIDLRLTMLWADMDQVEEWDLATVAAYIRAAYGAGYCAALTEREPGQLCRDHGYRVPSSR